MTSRSSARVSAPPLATLAAAAADPVANAAHAGAGGNSVFNHLAQPGSFPFYSKAIIESGLNDEGARTNDDAEDGFVALLKTSGCPGLDCLLSKNVSELLGADSKIPPNSVSARLGLVTFVADPDGRARPADHAGRQLHL